MRAHLVGGTLGWCAHVSATSSKILTDFAGVGAPPTSARGWREPPFAWVFEDGAAAALPPFRPPLAPLFFLPSAAAWKPAPAADGSGGSVDASASAAAASAAPAASPPDAAPLIALSSCRSLRRSALCFACSAASKSVSSHERIACERAARSFAWKEARAHPAAPSPPPPPPRPPPTLPKPPRSVSALGPAALCESVTAAAWP